MYIVIPCSVALVASRLGRHSNGEMILLFLYSFCGVLLINHDRTEHQERCFQRGAKENEAPFLEWIFGAHEFLDIARRFCVELKAALSVDKLIRQVNL